MIFDTATHTHPYNAPERHRIDFKGLSGSKHSKAQTALKTQNKSR